MNEKTDTLPELDHEKKVKLIMDMFHRIIVHYALWFTEVKHQMGMEKALDTLNTASEQSINIQMKRFSKIFGFDIKDNLPVPLLNMSDDLLQELMDTVAKNWHANDGVWFQAVEFTSGMNDAKRCNDSCWAHFSPFEAWSIKKFLNLGENSGLEGLKKALNLRLYAQINTQSVIDEGPESFIFQMNECRVQTTRKRKGLDDYPCKSAGNGEYPYFAKAIDKRIITDCIGCPPDKHPEQWYCAWRFKIKGSHATR